MIITEAWRDRWRARGWNLFGLALLTGLLALICHLLDQPVTKTRPRAVASTITLLPPPPSAPPPRLRPVPSRKPIPRHHAEFARATPAPAPKPLPPRPAPRAPALAVARPLTEASPPQPDPYQIPPGATQGFTIGGGGDSGDGGGGGGGAGGDECVGPNYYPAMINAALHDVLVPNEQTDKRPFSVQARLWFDAAGAVQRAQLVKSTGDIGLDTHIRTMLRAVHVDRRVPDCMQPATVWLNDPWDASAGPTSNGPTDSIDSGTTATMIWRNAPAR